MTWRDALWHAPGYALQVSLVSILVGLPVIFLREELGLLQGGDLSGLYYLLDLLSIIVIYPFAVAIGVGFFRIFPDRMRGRRGWRAVATGSAVAVLLWSGFGEWILFLSAGVGSGMGGSGLGPVQILIPFTPFAVSVTLAHAIGLLVDPGPPPPLRRLPGIPVGRPLKPVLPPRLTR